MKNEIKKLVIKRLKTHGLKMYKRTSSSGVFSMPTYERRTAYTIKDVNKLGSEGFLVDEDLGCFIFNAFMD